MAALSIGLYHAFAVCPIDDDSALATFVIAVKPFVANPGAVVLFFVLSGYVLTLSLRRERALDAPSITAYVARRWFRLIPAMWVSVCISYFVLQFAPSIDDKSVITEWFALELRAPSLYRRPS